MVTRKAIIASGLAIVFLISGVAVTPTRTEPDGPTSAPDFGKLPLSFVPNIGQADPAVRFLARYAGGTFFFTPQEMALVFSREPSAHENLALKIRFVGASPAPRIEGLNPLPGKVNYFISDDPARWQQGVPIYDGILYHDIYPHTDLRYRGSDGQLKYDFILRPGAEVERIVLAYAGAKGLRVNQAGQLEIETAWGVMVEEAPVAWQEGEGGQREPVEVRYDLHPGGHVGFLAGPYDPTRPLVIDPALGYSTFVGGSQDENAFALTLDGAGNAVVTGKTRSFDFPTTTGAYDTSYNDSGSWDVFVSKLSADGGSLLYSTFVGGNDDDIGWALALDGDGNIIVTGRTGSSDFPTTTGAYDASFNGGDYDVFIFKLTADGGSLLYSTFVGGSSTDSGHALALDGDGSAIVTGATSSSNFPTTTGAYDTSYNGDYDVFVLKLLPDGGALLYSTFVGGNDGDLGWALALDGDGNTVVAGNTYSSNFPTTAGAYDTTYNGVRDVFVLKLAADGGSLLYSTFVGGCSTDDGWALALDGDGNAVVAGYAYEVTPYTCSSNFPTTDGAYDTSHNGDDDAFVFKLAADGGSLLYSTFVGGNDTDRGYGLALDGDGNVVVTGCTRSFDFPTTAGAYDTSADTLDVFILKLSPDGGSLLYSTFVGGNGGEEGRALALDSAGNATITGHTASSSSFPTTIGAYDRSFNGGVSDVFVLRFDGLGGADDDKDGVPNAHDNCPNDANPGQEDGDDDGIGDVCDNCPNDPDNDADGDGVCGDVDNCPNTSNPGQEDADGDGVGDACDPTPYPPTPVPVGGIIVPVTKLELLAPWIGLVLLALVAGILLVRHRAER